MLVEHFFFHSSLFIIYYFHYYIISSHLSLHLTSESLISSNLCFTVSNDEEDVGVTIENKTSSPVEVAVWKGRQKIFLQKNVDASEFLVKISSKVFVFESDTYKVGDEFQVNILS